MRPCDRGAVMRLEYPGGPPTRRLIVGPNIIQRLWMGYLLANRIMVDFVFAVSGRSGYVARMSKVEHQYN